MGHANYGWRDKMIESEQTWDYTQHFLMDTCDAEAVRKLEAKHEKAINGIEDAIKLFKTLENAESLVGITATARVFRKNYEELLENLLT